MNKQFHWFVEKLFKFEMVDAIASQSYPTYSCLKSNIYLILQQLLSALLTPLDANLSANPNFCLHKIFNHVSE